ncbi:MAG: hypothetical protein GF315_08910 [candidate division Zixibacteria bacterium]|nr:hypothetical protein [candidate division Zixibacteria bacterium]
MNLSVCNLLGEKVTVLIDKELRAGIHQVLWDASEYSSGIYFSRLTAGDKVLVRRMTLLK